MFIQLFLTPNNKWRSPDFPTRHIDFYQKKIYLLSSYWYSRALALKWEVLHAGVWAARVRQSESKHWMKHSSSYSWGTMPHEYSKDAECREWKSVELSTALSYSWIPSGRRFTGIRPIMWTSIAFCLSPRVVDRLSIHYTIGRLLQGTSYEHLHNTVSCAKYTNTYILHLLYRKKNLLFIICRSNEHFTRTTRVQMREYHTLSRMSWGLRQEYSWLGKNASLFYKAWQLLAD